MAEKRKLTPFELTVDEKKRLLKYGLKNNKMDLTNSLRVLIDNHCPAVVTSLKDK